MTAGSTRFRIAAFAASALIAALAAPGLASAAIGHFDVSVPGDQVAGTAFNVTITAQDSTNATDTSYTGSHVITFAGPGNAPNGTQPSYPASVNFTNGVGTASVTLYNAESPTLTASDGTISGASSPFTVAPGSAASFDVPNPGSPTAGVAFNETLTALDAYKNTATGYTGAKTVTFADPASAPDGTAPLYPFSVTFASGQGTASITLYKAESTKLKATEATIVGETAAAFTVNPASAETFAIPDPGAQAASTAFDVSLTAQDHWLNIATGYSGSKSVTFSDPGSAPDGTTPSYPSSVTFTNGAATATIALFKAESTKLKATAGSVVGETAAAFTVAPGSAVALHVASATRTAGAQFNEAITAQDEWENTATSYAGNKAVTFSGPGNAPDGTQPDYPNHVSFTAGAGTAAITLYKAESTTLAVSDGTINGTSASFTVDPGQAKTFVVPNPGTRTAGVAFNETLTAKDTWLNVATGYTGSQTITFSGPTNAPDGTQPSYPSSVTFVAGVSSPAPSITLFKAQSTTLGADDGNGVSGTSTSFTVDPGSANTFVVPDPGTQTAGVAFNETLTAKDTWLNTATGYSGAKTIAFSDPSNAPDGTQPSYPSSVTFVAGVSSPAPSITLFKAESTKLKAVDGAIVGETTSAFTVNPGSAKSFAVPTPATQTAGIAFNVTLTAKDNWLNVATGYAGNKNVAFSDPGTSPAPSSTPPSYPSSVSFSAGVGTASITLFKAESTKLKAADGAIVGETTSAFTVNPGAPNFLTFIQQPPIQVQFATTMTPAITVKDQDSWRNNVATGTSVVMAIGTNPGGGVLAGTKTRTTDASGVATFNDLSVGPTTSVAAPGYTLAATSPSTSPSAGPTQSAGFVVVNSLANCSGTCSVSSTLVNTSVSANATQTGTNALGVAVFNAPPPSVCGATFVQAPGSAASYVNLSSTVSGQTLTVTVTLAKAAVQTLSDNGAAHYKMCLAAVDKLHPDGVGATPWTTASGAPAQSFSDPSYGINNIAYGGIIPMCPSVPTGPCEVSSKKNGGNLVFTYKVPYPWDPSAWFGP